MSKVYLLLRNNNQTGPHSLEELIQMGLKPLDLIWVEGKSFSWSYPSEISALKPYVAQADQPAMREPATKEETQTPAAVAKSDHQAYMPSGKEIIGKPEGASAKKVYVSMPANTVQPSGPTPKASPSAADLEQKAEELRKRTQAYALGQKTPVSTVTPATDDKPATKEDAIQTKYSRPVGELEEDYSSWIYNQKVKKKKNPSWIGIAGAIAAVILLGAGFAISRYDSSENDTITPNESATQQLTETDIPNNNDALIPAPTEPETTPPQKSKDENTSPAPVETVKKENNFFASNTSPAAVPKKEVHFPAKQTTVNTSTPASKPPVQPQAERQHAATPVETNNKTTVKAKEQTATAPATPEKKKTLGAAINGFFSKFKRKVDVIQDPNEESTPGPKQESKSGKQPVEKPQSTVQDPGTERKAKRRADETNPADMTAGKGQPEKTSQVQKTDFEDLVDINSNEPSEKWMLGIHGLKLTMHNRSNETLRTAAVEVRYYSEQNELLEKKIVTFTNVPPLKSVSQPIPDHRLADHTDFKFLSASN